MDLLNIKKINGYEELYTIFSDGKVWSIRKNKFLKPRLQGGYLCVRLYKYDQAKEYPIHRIVALHFLGNPYNKPRVNHKDGNKLNNRSDNLEWATDQENTIHSWNLGLSKYTSSEKRRLATSKKCRKFSKEIEQKIKEQYNEGKLQRELALEFKCSRHLIMKIVNNKHKV